jgi:hypothetical protein
MGEDKTTILQRLQIVGRTFVGAGLAVLSIYLFCAYLAYFFAALDLFQIQVLRITDVVALGAAATAGLIAALGVSWTRAPRFGAEKIELAAEILVRYCLAFILPIYGATKVLDVQFRLPFAALDTPLGEASGMALTWRFSGYSYAYELLLGLGELLGGGLLFFRRTTTLGACVLLPILANVAFLNFSHNIPVKFYSTCFLIMSCYLLGLDFPRLAALFLQNKGFGPRPTPELAVPPRLRKAMHFLKAGFIVFALVHAFVYILIADNKPSEISGSWAITQASPIGDPANAPQLSVRWKKIYFERGIGKEFPGSVREEGGGKPKRFSYAVNPEDRHLVITFSDPSAGPSFDGSYEFQDVQTLKLTGSLGDQRVEILLERQK